MLLATLSIWCNFHVNAIFDTGLSTSFSNKGFGQKARDQTKKPPSLREKCPYSYFSVFSPNVEKYGPE